VTPREAQVCERIRNAAAPIVAQAVARGELDRSDFCARCGDGERRVIAHHEDYLRPLSVEWLCFPCHAKRHEQIDLKPQILAIAAALGVEARNRLPYGYIPNALRRGLDYRSVRMTTLAAWQARIGAWHK
jgi:ribosomal protein S27AE